LGGDQRLNSARMKATDIGTDPLAHKRDNMEISAKRKRKLSAESNPSMESISDVSGEDRPFKKPRELRDVPKVVVTDAQPALSERHSSDTNDIIPSLVLLSTTKRRTLNLI
jgi:hypothetical protein